MCLVMKKNSKGHKTSGSNNHIFLQQQIKLLYKATDIYIKPEWFIQIKLFSPKENLIGLQSTDLAHAKEPEQLPSWIPV